MLTFHEFSSGKLHEGLTHDQEQVLVDLIDDAIGNEETSEDERATEKWIIAQAKKNPVTAKVPEAAILELIRAEY